MHWVDQHSWPDDKFAAYAFQDERRGKVLITGNCQEPQTVGAVEATYGHGATRAYAAAVVMSFPDLTVVEEARSEADVSFPYIPGLFYFREGPVMVGALKALSRTPDVLIVSGHGIAHPRSCGLASHLGLDFDIPTIGCARRLLSGDHRPVSPVRGSREPIIFRKQPCGVVYRSKDDVKPIYLSPGHRCDLAYTESVIARCLRGFRLPEPLRRAHILANRHKRTMEKRNGVTAKEKLASSG